MTVKVLRTEAEYRAAMAEIAALMERDPDPDTPEGDRLEVLALLVQDYESKRFPIHPPDPVEAILFRMEQQGLAPRDLVPYLGSRSKVSEVLSRKRPLTLSMIRALHHGLGIPASVLVEHRDPIGAEQVEWGRFPVKEMAARGWISLGLDAVAGDIQRALRAFVAPLGSSLVEDVLLHRTAHIRSARPMDEYALIAWCARVVGRALEIPPPVCYEADTVNLQFMRRVAQLSTHENAPEVVQELLREHGIALVVERNLPRAHFDGATIVTEALGPIVGLTLRHDRIDSYWFTLMHELAHVALHFDENAAYFDDLDVDLDIESHEDPQERQADELAGEALIPADEWRSSPASKLRSSEAAEHLANRLGIHPAIVAGRMRSQFRAYRLLNNVVGHGQVREHFPEVDWGR